MQILDSFLNVAYIVMRVCTIESEDFFCDPFETVVAERKVFQFCIRSITDPVILDQLLIAMTANKLLSFHERIEDNKTHEIKPLVV